MTLSSWLRDYLYIPLGGNRHGAFATYRNLMLTMLLGGLWHGANWTFLIWGAMHGGALVADHLWRATKSFARVSEQPSVKAVYWLLTFHFVCLAWIFFRAPSFDAVSAYFSGLIVDNGAAPIVTSSVLRADRRRDGDANRPADLARNAGREARQSRAGRSGGDLFRDVLCDPRNGADRLGAVHLLPVLNR